METQAMATAKTKKQITAKRKVFLQALEIIQSTPLEDGSIDFMKLADKLSPLLDNAPKSGWLAEEWAICSALWASEMPSWLDDVDRINEHCKGGERFLVAYFLGLRNGLRKGDAR
jgi:hypothetical protein